MLTLAASTLIEWLTGLGLMTLLTGLVFLAWWALFADRARGRRRCPECWYDLSWTDGMLCSECGFEGAAEKEFGRTRQRKFVAVLAILGCTAIGLYVIDRANTQGWLSYVPSRGLVAVMPLLDDPVHPVYNELDRRIKSNELTADAWIALVDRCAVGDGGARPPSDEWILKYGRLVDIIGARTRSGRTVDDDWRAEGEATLLTIPPRLDLSTRETWPVGVGPTIDVVARDWWPPSVRWRVRAMADVPGAMEDIHQLRDAPIQDRSYSMLLPPLDDGAHDVKIALETERRVVRPNQDEVDAEWVHVDTRTVTVPITVEGRMEETLTAVSGPELDEIVRSTFRQGLVKFRGGSLPVRVAVDPRRSFVELFDDTAVAIRIEVRRNGELGRMLDIWWAAGSGPDDRQHAWEVPWLDDAVLGAPARRDDEWTIRAYSVPEFALRVRDVTRYWEGDVTVRVPVRGQGRTAPSRGWIPAGATAGNPVPTLPGRAEATPEPAARSDEG
jgi:hypothetical protein